MSNTLFALDNKIAVITGGFGQLGQEFTRSLLEQGASVAIWGRTAVSNDQLRDAFGERVQNVIALQVDVAGKESILDALEQTQRRLGVPHILINNAGIDTQPSAPPEVSGPFEQFPEDVWREVMDVNLTGVFLCCQAVGGAMAEAGRGSIINIGSIYGMLSPVQDIYAYKEAKTGRAFTKPVAYCASKSGIYNLTRYLGTYWGKKGVRVNTLTPSGVFRDDQDKEFVENYCNRIPIGRMARPGEYNGAIIFLASDASLYMTGSNLVIDGGWTAW
ncbi:SDR family oxidoreductase [Sodalis sp. RH21]|uniref:SDR family oxidoreductase n=1 Tax=unclassified Sodalis (in: enterobacteria) TaxID=2636512 RepID=UPI0039B45171